MSQPSRGSEATKSAEAADSREQDEHAASHLGASEARSGALKARSLQPGPGSADLRGRSGGSEA